MLGPLAAAPGFEFGDLYAIGLAFVGLALFAAIAALSHQQERAFSASLIYLVLGLTAAAAVELLGVHWFDPVDDAELVERLTEFCVIVALFSTGLKLDRELSWRAWAPVTRLLAVVMPLTIAGVALFGTQVMGLSLGAAVVLGSVLAPTDPVLAGDIGVGPPGEEEERNPNFAVTGEAGLNDGLAFPFVFFGVLAAGEDDWSWLGEWVTADVLYAIVAGVVAGGAAGYGLAALFVPLRERELLSHDLDGWVALATVLLVYGATEAIGAYGFLAAFTSGLAFRRYERDHEYNRRVHGGAETAEKFAELAIILLLGSLVTLEGLSEPGWGGWLLVPVLLLVIRPLAVFAAFAGSGTPLREQVFLGWFGVRGVGSLYYAAFAVGLGTMAGESEVTVFWTVVVCTILSIVAHGATGAPLGRRLLR
ncbi:MAG: cation:proton antiporter [Thermoleophilia bacterium]|nr:cation:proton antiporter [Thermoleophilia bacterium]